MDALVKQGRNEIIAYIKQQLARSKAKYIDRELLTNWLRNAKQYNGIKKRRF
jgi:hypothetical protein